MRHPLCVALLTALVAGCRKDGLPSLARRVDPMVSPVRLESQLAALTRVPHRAGTPGNDAARESVLGRLRSIGLPIELLDDEAVLPEPLEAGLEIVSAPPVRFEILEKVLPEDPFSTVAATELPFLAYSPDADLSAPVVYANYGDEADYDLLAARGISLGGRIALVRAQGICRGRKAEIAARRGVAGLLLYPELRDQGFVKPAYPAGPHLNDWTSGRGTLLAYFRSPGPPERTVARGAPDTRPRIPALPVTPAVAKVLLGRIEGPDAPDAWTGWMKGVPYRLGEGPTVRMLVRGAVVPRKLRSVVARLSSGEPGPPLVVGAHLDAWVYGASDPSSGVAVVLEAAEVLSRLAASGWKPRRDVLFAFWDGEEYGMFGSSRFVEKRLPSLGALAAYVNVDSAVRGGDFLGSVMPGLRGPLDEVLGLVTDPGAARLILEVRGTFNLPGFSSDTAPFSGWTTTPVAEIGFGRWYPQYHSVYDSLAWYRTFADPGFVRTACLARVLTLYLARLADGRLLPDRFAELGPYARSELGSGAGLPEASSLALRDALDAFTATAAAWDRRERESRDLPPAQAREINATLLRARAAFDGPAPDGLPPFGATSVLIGPSPATGCGAEAFPPLARSRRDPAAAEAQLSRLTGAFREAAARLTEAVFALR